MYKLNVWDNCIEGAVAATDVPYEVVEKVVAALADRVRYHLAEGRIVAIPDLVKLAVIKPVSANPTKREQRMEFQFKLPNLAAIPSPKLFHELIDAFPPDVDRIRHVRKIKAHAITNGVHYARKREQTGPNPKPRRYNFEKRG